EARLRSVVIDRVMHALATQYFNIVGILIIFTQPISFPLWFHLLLLAVYVVLCSILTTVIVQLVTGQGFGAFEHLFRWFDVARRFPKVHDVLCELKSNLAYYRDRPKTMFFKAFAYHFAGRVLGAVEIMIAFYAFSGRLDFTFGVILAALTSFFAATFGFIPGALGILEGLYASLFSLYGFSPDMGVSVQIVRRLRVLLWVGVGIGLMDYEIVGVQLKKIKHNIGMKSNTNNLTK
ncbi:MAG TPA: lysylphosphatidylglycerol synthase domain-containing protein, partial [bacterium]|nr:lysylphosphatidylglycerol synthase domain-containing protein [bacterium]